MKDKFYFQEDSYKLYKERENELMQTVEVLEDEFRRVMLDQPINYKELLSNPIEYIANEYWNEYASKNFPKHIQPDKLNILKQTSIDTKYISYIHEKYKSLYKGLYNYAPEVTESELKSNVKEETFTRAMDKGKKQVYQLAQEFESALSNLVDAMPEGSNTATMLRNRFDGMFEMDLTTFKWKVNRSQFI